MYIRHESIKINGENKIYIYVELEDEYEFGEEFLKPDKTQSFFDKLKNYLMQDVEFDKNDVATLVVNGVLIGAISLGVFTNAIEQEVKVSNAQVNKSGYEVAVDYMDKTNKEKAKVIELEKQALDDAVVKELPPEINVGQAEATTNVAKPNIVTTAKTTTPTKTATTETATPIKSGTSIKLNTNGSVVTMNLEDYVVGVVASEMPITFHAEALKSQAVVARTFAMKKASQGITLLNSTSHQTYKSESQLKKMWGNSYTTNINKIKNAVNSTSGMVLKYNGGYIDAMYHSISNSKTEMPKYVWGSNLPYLQSVNSNWDTGVKGYEVSTNISYSTLTSKLGKSINKNTSFKILSETVSGRVEKIQIGDSTYSGVKLRSILGLRSTDFSITKGDSGVTVTTKGFGHGVGMSQSGANEAAKDGYSYDRILKHYYTGVTLSKI